MFLILESYIYQKNFYIYVDSLKFSIILLIFSNIIGETEFFQVMKHEFSKVIQLPATKI